MALLATLLRASLLHGRAVPTAAPGCIMAVGIFALAALHHLSPAADRLSEPVAIALLVLWGHLALSFALSAASGTLGTHIGPPVGRFAVGTWVAGTAVLARLVALAVPGWGAVGIALGGIACAIWGWFIALALGGFRAIVETPDAQRANGVVLLSTVSTQSIAFLAFGLLPAWPLLRSAAVLLVVLGYGLYLLGAALILRRYVRQTGWRLAEDWENSNCILHGAMSITGLAAVTGGGIPFAVCYGTWLYAAGAFLLVEAVEAARLVQRRRIYGWRRGLCVYHVTQWSRNFTFGMFYAFTLAFAERFGAMHLPPAVEAAQAAVLAWGPDTVLALLLIEAGLFAWTRIGPGPRDRGTPTTINRIGG